MKTFLSIICAFCVSCGPYINAEKGIVSTGFMSKTVAFAGKLKTPSGASAVWSVTGHDGTEVPIAASNVIGTGWAVGKAAQTSQFNTANTTAQQANARVPTVTQPAQMAPGTTVFPLVTQPAAAIVPALPK